MNEPTNKTRIAALDDLVATEGLVEESGGVLSMSMESGVSPLDERVIAWVEGK